MPPHQAKQKLSDYRNGVAAEAMTAVAVFMRSRRFKHSPEARAAYVEWALSEDLGFPFRYEKIIETPTGREKRIGAYRNKLIVRTLGYHLKRIMIRAENIHDHPCNALALAVTAVERALKMWETGHFEPPKPRSEESKFSDRLWGRAAHEYMASIIDLSDEQWDKILALAEQHARGLIPDDTDSEDDETGDYDAGNLPITGGRATLDDTDSEDGDDGHCAANERDDHLKNGNGETVFTEDGQHDNQPFDTTGGDVDMRVAA
ncbi:hypothetical protein C8Q77DRAFT_71063 [Trametes polyzona]|nr:hypothetical protein C8Q77DRAFT_71063 [Trametes polyzona]